MTSVSNLDPSAGLSPPPDPPKGRQQKRVPEEIACVLVIVRVLLAYGRHLAHTLEHRAARRTFSVIAQYFGTHRLSFILVRLARGILRAVALERVLLARAARGRDLVRYTLEDYRPRRPAKKPQQKKPRPPPRPDPDASLDFDHLPSIEDLEKEIRRRPIGQTLVAICCDLGVGFSLCDGNFSFDLQRAIHGHRGNYTKYYRTIRGREVEFEKEQDRDRTVRFDLPERNRDRVKAILGFFIGEEPVCPFPLPLAAVPEALAARPP